MAVKGHLMSTGYVYDVLLVFLSYCVSFTRYSYTQWAKINQSIDQSINQNIR